MDQADRKSGQAPGDELWTLRLAGSQEDANPEVWAKHVREEGFSPGRWAGVIARRRWLAFTVLVALLAPAVTWVMLLDPVYQGSTRLLVKDPSPPGSGGVDTTSEISQTMDELRGADLLRRTAGELGLGPDGVRMLAEQIQVVAVPESSLISIEYVHEDADFAASVVKTLSDLYINPGAGMEMDAPLSEEDRLEAESYEKMLDAARKEIAEIERENDLQAVAGQRNSGASRASQLDTEAASIERQIRDVEIRLNLLERQAAELPSSIGPRTTNRALAERLRGLAYELQRQRNGLLTRYDASDPLVRDVDVRLNETKEAIDRAEVSGAELAGIVTSMRAAIGDEQIRAQADLSRWRAREGEIANAQGVVAARQSRLRRLADRRAELEATASAAEQKLDALRGSAAPPAPRMNVTVLESARALPVDRQRPLLLTLAALLALGAALACAAIYDERNKPAAYVADIAAATAAPVLCLTEETHSHVS